MVTTSTTRFRCRSPLRDWLKHFAVFRTLLFNYLKKRVERMVRDFTPPRSPFHAIKVQRFKNQYVKRFAKFGRKFPVPIFSVSGNFSMMPCQSTARTIVVARTFDFTTQFLAERSQRLQGLFEKLRTYYLSACVACEECFVSIIKPCAFTRLGFRFGSVNSLTRKAYPIVAAF